MKFNPVHLLAVALVSSILAAGAMHFVALKALETEKNVEQETSHERVMRTQTLRCAYATYDDFLNVGPDGKKSGILYDAIEEAAKRLNLKVEWTEEVGYGNIYAGFETKLYDAFCAGLWPSGARAGHTLFSVPIVWTPISVWVRADDTRFDGDLKQLDQPDRLISVIEGDTTAAMADSLFPNAGRTVLSQNQSISQGTMNVLTKKADAIFHDYLYADKFLSHLPGSIRDLSPGKPLLYYGLSMSFPIHELVLRDMFDIVLKEMHRDGTINKIVVANLGDRAHLLYQEDVEFLPQAADKTKRPNTSERKK